MADVMLSINDNVSTREALDRDAMLTDMREYREKAQFFPQRGREVCLVGFTKAELDIIIEALEGGP